MVAPAFWLVWGRAPKSSETVTAVTPVHVLDRLRVIDAVRDLGVRLSAATPLEAASLTAVGVKPHTIFASETLGDYLLWDLGQGQARQRFVCAAIPMFIC